MLDVLLADDDEIVRESIAEALAAAGHHVTQAPDGEAALGLLAAGAFDLAICDVHMPKVDGLTVFRRLRTESPRTAVVIMTSFGTIPEVIGCLRGGAVDFVTKPFDPEEFTRTVVGPLAERRALRKAFEEAQAQLVATEAGTSFVGTSTLVRQLSDRISLLVQSDASVFVSGARGTGKKLIARMLHAHGPRRDGPFLVVPCGSLPALMRQAEIRELAELRRGSSRDGWFRAAEGGTLVLDGIDQLDAGTQNNLRRVIDEPLARARRDHQWRPHGVRIVSISRSSPEALCGGAGLLDALLYRLNTVHLRAPTLGERLLDLPLLVSHFLRKYTPEGGMPPRIAPDAWKALSAYDFPGNVRELEWVVERALVAADGEEIALRHLPDQITQRAIVTASSRPLPTA